LSQDGAGRDDPYSGRRRWVNLGLAVLVILAFLLSLTLGAVEVRPLDALRVIAQHLGLDTKPVISAQADSVVWGIRLPRTLLGLLVGAALAASGGVLQGSLRNQLADPHLLGIGPGSAIGAALGAGVAGVRGAIAGGVATGVLTAFAIRRLRRRMAIDPNRLILAGVALGVTLSAWVGFIVFGLDRSVVPPIEFWLLGSLAGATWRGLETAAFLLMTAFAVMIGAARTLDILALGDREAWHLGVDVELTTSILYIVVGAAVGVTVGTVGVVVFVGLLVPFLVRRGVGPSHRHLIPTGMLGGALFLVVSDLVARSIIQPIEIPVGLVTAAVGGPLFLWLVTRASGA
jgi:iron complex transport system permease protein